ncbi:hypothetical protein NE586_09330 [Gemmiger formicilis]|uniref:hypothetical protein n=1 Tax=Gemmiger formicilis TaxID=745368 RepID=UPI00210A5CF9|nr:hypothetical protein [Gemmiger formicilis]MCQ5080092.1 hypothetical protein [Gemmiger formicilis]MCQ5116919.1 hypothetical protein [Gemmiger formicilis]
MEMLKTPWKPWKTRLFSCVKKGKTAKKHAVQGFVFHNFHHRPVENGAKLSKTILALFATQNSQNVNKGLYLHRGGVIIGSTITRIAVRRCA